MIGIYKITNKITDQVYIGQSVHIERRWQEHSGRFQYGYSKLYQAMQEYGIENFAFEIIEKCEATELDKKERYWIKYYNSYKKGYNSTPGGQKQFIDNSQKIYQLWDEGYCSSEIVEQTGLGHTTVQNYLMGYDKYSVQESRRRGGLKATKKDLQTPNIFQYDLQGNYIGAWFSTKQIQRELGIDSASIGKVIRGIRKSAGGYYWSSKAPQ